VAGGVEYRDLDRLRCCISGELQIGINVPGREVRRKVVRTARFNIDGVLEEGGVWVNEVPGPMRELLPLVKRFRNDDRSGGVLGRERDRRDGDGPVSAATLVGTTDGPIVRFAGTFAEIFFAYNISALQFPPVPRVLGLIGFCTGLTGVSASAAAAQCPLSTFW
jgi:hypothetical protein